MKTFKEFTAKLLETIGNVTGPAVSTDVPVKPMTKIIRRKKPNRDSYERTYHAVSKH
jgi:hypothetical protein